MIDLSAGREHVQVDEYGPMFTLRPGWSLDRIHREPSRDHKPLMCRIRHRREVIGDPYYEPDTDLMGSVLALLANADTTALTRCKRCGVLSTKGRY